MKVLIINYAYYIIGGPERYLLNLEELLLKYDHEVYVFSQKLKKNKASEFVKYFPSSLNANNNFFFEKQFKISSIIKYINRTFFSKEVYSKLNKLIQNTNPDIAIILQYHKKLSPAVIKCCKDNYIPVVVRLSDYLMMCPQSHFFRNNNICELCKINKMYSIKNKCVKNSYVYSLLWFIADKYHHLAGFYSMVDTFIATNNFMKEKLIEYGYKNVVVIPTFTKRIDIVINYRNKKKQICFIGRITNYKGIDLLVSAFSRVINIHSDAKLIIVGRDQEGYFSKKTHLKNIEYIGIQKSSVVRKVLSESLYTVLPVKWYENLPNVIIESFSTGTPVISTNIGSISEMIKDGITGYLTQYNSVEDLYLKIINALGISEEKYKAMQYNCIREFNNIYCSEKHYLRLMELAKSVIERQIQ